MSISIEDLDELACEGLSDAKLIAVAVLAANGFGGTAQGT